MKLIKLVIFWDEILIRLVNLAKLFTLLWPYIKIKDHLKKNLELKDLHKGERCFILLHGLSANDVDLALLAQEQVFCVNHCYNTDAYNVVKPNYYCAVDSHFFNDRYLNSIDNHISKIVEVTNKTGSKCLFSHDFLRNFDCSEHVYLSFGKHTPTRGVIRSDLTSIVSGFGSVSLFAINAAIYMGFKEIYLVGYDFPPGGLMPHFYRNSNEEVLVRGEIEAHSDLYSVSELHWQYYRAQVQHYYIKAYAEKNNVSIYNCSEKSHVRSFEFKNFADINFKKISNL